MRDANKRHTWESKAATAGEWQETLESNRIFYEISQLHVNPGTATSFVLTIEDPDGVEIYNSGTLTDEHTEHTSLASFNGVHTVKLASVSPATGTFTRIRVLYR